MALVYVNKYLVRGKFDGKEFVNRLAIYSKDFDMNEIQHGLWETYPQWKCGTDRIASSDVCRNVIKFGGAACVDGINGEPLQVQSCHIGTYTKSTEQVKVKCDEVVYIGDDDTFAKGFSVSIYTFLNFYGAFAAYAPDWVEGDGTITGRALAGDELKEFVEQMGDGWCWIKHNGYTYLDCETVKEYAEDYGTVSRISMKYWDNSYRDYVYEVNYAVEEY